MNLRDQARESFSWSILIQLSNQIIGFIVSIILARILFPKDFGIIGMISIFITLGNSLLDGGLASSLIRNKDVNQDDYSTVFFTNIVVAIIIYAFLFLIAPLVALFFNQTILTNLLRIYGIVLLIGSLSIVQSVRLNKNLQFKTQFKLLIPSVIISAIVSIWMAYNGFGVWSLVWKEIVFSGLASCQLWYYAKWKPSYVFNKELFKFHFNFGSKLLITDILTTFFNDFYKIIVGKFFSATQLGFYTRAKSTQELPSNIIFNSINRVLYPLLSNINNDDVRLKKVFRQIIETVHFLVVPILVLLAFVAKPLFIFLLTDKWIEAVPYFKILIIAALLSPMQSYMFNICKVKGRSDLVLKLSSLQYLLLALGLIPSIWFGIFGLLWAIVFVTAITSAITAYYSGKLIGYTLKEQLLDVYQPFLISAFAGLLLFILSHFLNITIHSNLFIILFSSMVFILMFFLMSLILKNSVFVSGLTYLKTRFNLNQVKND